MTQDEEEECIVRTVRMLAHMPEERIRDLWLEFVDCDEETRRVFREAARRVRDARLRVLPAANRVAA